MSHGEGRIPNAAEGVAQPTSHTRTETARSRTSVPLRVLRTVASRAFTEEAAACSLNRLSDSARIRLASRTNTGRLSALARSGRFSSATVVVCGVERHSASPSTTVFPPAEEEPTRSAICRPYVSGATKGRPKGSDIAFLRWSSTSSDALSATESSKLSHEALRTRDPETCSCCTGMATDPSPLPTRATSGPDACRLACTSGWHRPS
jgi:hypothetical protein